MDYPVTRQASLYEWLNNSSIIWQKDFCGPKPASYVNDDQFLLYRYVSNFIFEQIFNYKTLVLKAEAFVSNDFTSWFR